MWTFRTKPIAHLENVVREKTHHKPVAQGHSPAWASKPLRRKLAVNKPGDAHEQEADRVAEQVMRKPAHSVQRCTCGGSAGPDGECAECRAKRLSVQRKASGGEMRGR